MRNFVRGLNIWCRHLAPAGPTHARILARGVVTEKNEERHYLLHMWGDSGERFIHCREVRQCLSHRVILSIKDEKFIRDSVYIVFIAAGKALLNRGNDFALDSLASGNVFPFLSFPFLSFPFLSIVLIFYPLCESGSSDVRHSLSTTGCELTREFPRSGIFGRRFQDSSKRFGCDKHNISFR